MIDEPVRILQCGMTDNYGGVEAFIMNVYRNIDRAKVQFDFLTVHDKKIACEEEIKKMGGRIFYVEYSKKDNFIKHYTELNKFFNEYANEFMAVHMHSCFPNYSLPLKYAKKFNINVRIFHSHNSEDMYKSKYILVELIKKVKYCVERIMIRKRATKLLACSEEAGKYMFKKSDYEIIKNGINIERFKFNEDARRKIRAELNIDNNIVLGFVGRLQYQKNPIYALRIIKELNKENKNYKLLMIGNGILEEEVKQYINKNNLTESVILLGQRNDVDKLYQAMDIFLLPSNFEGLGIVLIEAQTSGLKCVTSNQVPLLTKVTKNITYNDLQDLDSWINDINKFQENVTDRKSTYYDVKKGGFDINDTVIKLTNCYCGGNI